MLKNKADQKEFTENPPTIKSHNKMINAFTASKKSPNVKMVMGSVKRTIKGFMNKLSKLKTMATHIEFMKSVT
jgi:hypothetical protein